MEKIEIITDEVFEKLVELVSIGVNIKHAIRTIGCNRFYELATEEQKVNIKLHKPTSGGTRLY